MEHVIHCSQPAGGRGGEDGPREEESSALDTVDQSRLVTGVKVVQIRVNRRTPVRSALLRNVFVALD